MSAFEQLWAGWRHEYVIGSTEEERSGGETCVFCRIALSGPPSADNGIVHLGEACFAVLNAYPYASGHLLVLPIRHVEELANLTEGEGIELWETTRVAAQALGRAYAPDGINLGANLGRAAGAGIPGHLHLHVVPRWAGDTNFMTSVAGVRVLPESLGTAWERLHRAWPA
ncbi:MAG TPA: HIT domain-containing protein [Acidimicrobiales bacterium]|nr:HIT domain-containing protein [Acidimicrobiales bacterium]